MEPEAARGETENEEESACLLMISRNAVGRCEFAENGDRLVAERSLWLKERRIRQKKFNSLNRYDVELGLLWQIRGNHNA